MLVCWDSSSPPPLACYLIIFLSYCSIITCRSSHGKNNIWNSCQFTSSRLITQEIGDPCLLHFCWNPWTPAFQKYSICWVCQAFFCSTFSHVFWTPSLSKYIAYSICWVFSHQYWETVTPGIHASQQLTWRPTSQQLLLRLAERWHNFKLSPRFRNQTERAWEPEYNWVLCHVIEWKHWVKLVETTA